MTSERNTRIVLANRAPGRISRDHFRVEQTDIPSPGTGEVLLQTNWLSLDPYMRGRMVAGRSYAKPVEIGETMVGETIGTVLASNHPKIRVGESYAAQTGWQTHAKISGDTLRRIDTSLAPAQTWLGLIGMPGMTAYTGLLTIGKPVAGETLVVAAATGPVGATVGQIAKLKGLRVVGIAGGPEKSRYLVDELGFDAGIDHRAHDFREQLAKACGNGIDIYFENVGGLVWKTVVPLFNDFARIPVCGVVAQYNSTGPDDGPDFTAQLMRTVLTRRLTIRGFIVTDFADQARAFKDEMTGWVKSGAIKTKEHVIDGLENAPEGLADLIDGKFFGKALVRVS